MDDLDLGQTVRGFSPGQQVFNRFTLQRILGRGGMGVVWLARDDELEREVALKFLPDIVALDRESVAELKRETRRNLELTHPHIVRIYDFVQDPRAAAISMEFVNGSSLSAAKVDRPGGIFALADVRRWAAQLCEALSYAHGRARVVHRDLKPANLMIDAAGELKVTDFGIACSIADSVSRVSKNVGSSGTPLYMSPQQMMGEKPSAADDIYAIGATLFELLAGKPPFYTGNVILQVQSKVPESIAARREALGAAHAEPVPAEWERVIACCLAKEPGQRPASVAALAEELGLTGTFTPAAASPSPPPPVVAEPPPVRAAAVPAAPAKARGSKAGLWIGLGAGVVALGAVAFWAGDGPNRIRASGRMAEGQVALQASDWPAALGALREAAALRPSDQEYRRAFDEAQRRWFGTVQGEILQLDARRAHDRLEELAPIAVLLDGSAAGDYLQLHASRTQAARETVEAAMKVARTRTEAFEFRAALDALAAVRGHGSLVPGFADAEREVRLARLRRAVEQARPLAAERRFDSAFMLLDEAREDAALLGDEHPRAVRHVQEAQVTFALGTIREGQYPDGAAFTEAFGVLDRLRREGVLPAAVEEAAGELRRRAESFSTERLARALVAGQAAEADAAIADYARFAGTQFNVTGAALVGERELGALLAALESLRMRPAAGQVRAHGRDIAIVAAVRGRLADAAAVRSFLAGEYMNWSRVEEAAGRPGLALYLSAEARREGAAAEGDRERKLTAALAGDVGLKLAWGAPRIEGSAGEPLRSEPVRGLRAALEQRVGAFLKPANGDGPGTLMIATTLAGPTSSDNPTRQRRTVRYQSGTRQVNNQNYANLQQQIESAVDDMRRAERARNYAEAEAKRQAASTTDPNAALAAALAGGIAVGLHQNNYNKAANLASSLRAQLRQTPRMLTEATYADEAYDVITHNMTYSADIAATVEHVATPVRWRGQVTHQTVEITGNKDRGVPVQAPTYPAAAALHRQLAQQLGERVRDPAPILGPLSRASLLEVADRATKEGHDAATRADDMWGIVLLWRSIPVEPEGAAQAEQEVRAALGLPRR